MADDGENQLLQQIRFEEDRISRLPDCLLVEIVSRLPDTKYAIRTGALSKRWVNIWHSVPNLIFLDPLDAYIYTRPYFICSVEKSLTQRPHLKLKTFTLYTRNDGGRFISQIHNSIRYAVNCNVEDLSLKVQVFEHTTVYPVDQFVFTGSSFTNLTFSGCSFNLIGAISWKNLRSLCISGAKLDEDLIENILSGSPVLETLELKYCYSYKRLNITSKSVKRLVFFGYIFPYYSFDNGVDVIEINAPNISSLTIQGNLCFGRLLLLNVSSFVEVHLDFIFNENEDEDKDEEEMLKGVILSLRHVEDLQIGPYCFDVLTRLEAQGFVYPSNLKVVHGII